MSVISRGKWKTVASFFFIIKGLLIEIDETILILNYAVNSNIKEYNTFGKKIYANRFIKMMYP